jgi:hypothetical protein
LDEICSVSPAAAPSDVDKAENTSVREDDVRAAREHPSDFEYVPNPRVTGIDGVKAARAKRTAKIETELIYLEFGLYE